MNAYCTTCKSRTQHRRTQSGSWFRFYCRICDTELRDTDTAARLNDLRRPVPNQAAIDAKSVTTLKGDRNA